MPNATFVGAVEPLEAPDGKAMSAARERRQCQGERMEYRQFGKLRPMSRATEAGSSAEPFPQEANHAVPREARRVSVRVRKILSQHRMCVGWNTPACVGRLNHNPFEISCKRSFDRGEPLSRTDAVVREAQAHQSNAGLVARLSAREILAGHGQGGASCGGYCEGQRWLSRNRRKREVIGQERNREIAGETQADNANLFAAILGENFASISAEPIDDRAIAAPREEMELAANAEPDQEQDRVVFTRLAEEKR
jgi:hypothetical protein